MWMKEKGCPGKVRQLHGEVKWLRWRKKEGAG